VVKRAGYWVVTLLCLVSLGVAVAWPAQLPQVLLTPQQHGFDQSDMGLMAKAGQAITDQDRLPWYQQAAEVAPTNIIAVYNLAVTQYQLAIKTGNEALLTEAARSFERVVALNPEVLSLYFKLGKIALLQHNVAQAEQWYRQGLEVDPDNASLTFNLAEVLEQQNHLTEAKAHYIKSIALDPDMIYAYNNLGLLYEKANALSQAESCYLKALTVNPNYAHARLNLGALYDTQGLKTDAQTQFKHVLQQDPQNPWANFYLGGQAYRDGHFTEALPYLQAATSSHNSIHAAYYFLALTYIKLNRLDEALNAGQTYLTLEQDGPFWQEMHTLVNSDMVRNAATTPNP
jgi:tetratricopeptide (TPR) repeat protein